MQSTAQAKSAAPAVASTIATPADAVAALTEVLLDEYGASAETEDGDELHSPIVWPNIVRIRGVIRLLRGAVA